MKRIPVILSICMLCFAVALNAQEKKKKPSNEVTVTGEVIDSQCYLSMGAKGDDHKQCAIDCAKGGIALALLEDKSGTVYFLGQTKDQMKGANEMLVDHAAHKVTVKGKLVEKGGAKMILISSVEMVK